MTGEASADGVEEEDEQEDNEAEEEADADAGDNFFKVYKTAPQATIVDSSRLGALEDVAHDWTDAITLDLIRNRFVTGSWEENDAAKVCWI